MAAYSGPFYYFDQAVQAPFADGVTATVSEAMSAVQGPLTAVIVLWVIVSGILVMRGDITARSGISRIVSVSLVVGILMSTTLYNEYVTTFFVTSLPNWIAQTMTGTTGVQASAQEFDTIWIKATAVFAEINPRFHWWNVIYDAHLAILQLLLIVPIGVMFLIYEVAKIMIDVVVSIGPFLLVGYLFAATRGVADRFVGKLISLSILVLLVNIVLSIIVEGYLAYIADTLGQVTSNTNRAFDIAVCDQMEVFFVIGALVATFLPGLAAYFGGGVSVSPMAMASSVISVVSMGKTLGGSK